MICKYILIIDNSKCKTARKSLSHGSRLLRFAAKKNSLFRPYQLRTDSRSMKYHKADLFKRQQDNNFHWRQAYQN